MEITAYTKQCLPLFYAFYPNNTFKIKNFTFFKLIRGQLPDEWERHYGSEIKEARH